jgi:prepilin-type N-terminal cleavage/methylation domain-containing protein
MRTLRGFTLIELLIVVAIIAILAAIAVPNFLEAQVRAKVSRVRSDQRTIATAMEAYAVDHNWYPPDSDNTILRPTEDETGLLYLTTPVAYITTLARDPFQLQEADINNDTAKFYEVGSGTDNGTSWVNPPYMGGDTRNGSGLRANTYIIISVGPNRLDNVEGNDEWPGREEAPQITVNIATYDPTNGSISGGDLIRAGGQTSGGRYFINGQLNGKLND